jgi:predicted nucleotidyltransferase
MHSHHSQAIQNVKEYFARDPEVLALSGSIAHGLEGTTSDVDIMIFV